MKTVEINKTGGPEVLELKDITLDEPGPDQVQIEQKAIGLNLSLIHISEPTRPYQISYAVFCLKKKKDKNMLAEEPHAKNE